MFFKSVAVVAALFVLPQTVDAATMTVGPGGYDDGWATQITYEADDSIARRGVTHGRNNPLNALGAPDGGKRGGFFELGFRSQADFTFGTWFDTSVSVWEITFSNATGFPEFVNVFVGKGSVFQSVATISNSQASGGASMSLAGLVGGPFDTVRLVDNSPFSSAAERDAQGPLGGFDIDAVRISPVPLPASSLLLITALGGMVMVRRRMAAA